MKKCGLIVVGLALLGTLVFGGSYVRYAVHQARQAISDAESLPMKIGRLRSEVESITPKIRHAEHQIAKAEVELQALKEEIGYSEDSLAKSERDILRLKTDIESENSYFTYAGKSYSKGEVRKDLERRFERHKIMEDTSSTQRDQLSAKEAALKANHDKLAAMKAAKEKLLVDIENFEARLEKLAAKQTINEFNIDDGPVSEAKKLARDIDVRLKTAEKLSNAHSNFEGINLDEPENKDLLDEIAEHFDGAPKTEAVAGN